jgi:hypothetical protein
VFFRAPSPRSKSNTALTNFSALFGRTSTSQTVWAQFISDPLDGAQTVDGDANIVVAGLEGGNTEDLHISFVLRLVSNDGSVVRGVHASWQTTGTEFATTQQTRIVGGRAITSTAAQDGDRLVMEVGFHGVTPANSTNNTLRFGDPSATSNFALTSGLTTDLVPWWRHDPLGGSPELVFQSATNIDASGSPVATLSAFASGTAEQIFQASGSPVATLSAFASGTASITEFVASGAPVATLSAFASGTAVQTFSASGSPVATLSAFASGTASNVGHIASGSPVATLSAFASGTAVNTPPEIIPHVPAKGGRARRIVVRRELERPQEPQKKRRRSNRPVPVFEAQERPVEPLEGLPEVTPLQIDPEVWQRILTVTRVMEPPQAPEPETFEPIGDIEARLVQHFLETAVGATPPELELDIDSEDIPFLLKRFLRLGR